MKLYFEKEWKLCALFALVTLPLAFLAPYKSYVIQWLIDAESASEIPRLLGVGGLIFLSVFLLEWLGRNIFARINTSIARAMREDLIEGTLCCDLGEFKQNTVGSYVSQITNDITAIQNEFLTSLYNITLYGGMLVCSLIFLYRIHPLMLLIAVIMAIFPAVMPHAFARFLKKTRSDFSQENADYVTTGKDILQGFETLRSFGAEAEAKSRHSAAAASLSNAELRYSKVINCNIAMTSFVGQIVFYSVLAIGITLVFKGNISIGYLVTATNLINFTNQPVQVISQSVSKIIATTDIRHRLVLVRQNTHQGVSNFTGSQAGNLSLQHVYFRYNNNDAYALNDINCTFLQNKKYAIMGPSGSGKSTLAKVISGMYRNYEGNILYDGKELRNMSHAESTHVIETIPQNPFIFNGTVYENITLFSKQWTQEEVLSAEQRSGLSDFLAKLPQGLNSELKESNLSGGQAQRIGIARALLRKPYILIADEPTASLDSGLADDIERLVMSWPGTAILITHRKSQYVLDHADGVINLANGAVLNLT